jgi:hypothetical protein
VVATAGGFRGWLADHVRAIGAGAAQASEQVGLASDHAYIYPTEGAFAAARAAGQLPLPHVVSTVGNVGAYLTAADGMIVGSLLRTPGGFVRDTMNALADTIDGGKSAAGADYGFMWADETSDDTPPPPATGPTSTPATPGQPPLQ